MCDVSAIEKLEDSALNFCRPDKFSALQTKMFIGMKKFSALQTKMFMTNSRPNGLEIVVLSKSDLKHLVTASSKCVTL